MPSDMYTENCHRCGWCCKAVFRNIENRSAYPDGSIIANMIDAFPYKKADNGYCEMYKNGLCSVYEIRPALCDSRKIIEIIRANGEFTKEDERRYYVIQKELCDSHRGR